MRLGKGSTGVRNPWLALFELTNHNSGLCNAIIEFVSRLVNSNNTSQWFPTLRWTFPLCVFSLTAKVEHPDFALKTTEICITRVFAWYIVYGCPWRSGLKGRFRPDAASLALPIGQTQWLVMTVTDCNSVTVTNCLNLLSFSLVIKNCSNSPFVFFVHCRRLQ